MSTYVAKATNIPGGERYEVDAELIEGRYEFTAVDAPPETGATIMEVEDFEAAYEPATTPVHYLDGTPVATSAPPMV